MSKRPQPQFRSRRGTYERRRPIYHAPLSAKAREARYRHIDRSDKICMGFYLLLATGYIGAVALIGSFTSYPTTPVNDAIKRKAPVKPTSSVAEARKQGLLAARIDLLFSQVEEHILENEPLYSFLKRTHAHSSYEKWLFESTHLSSFDALRQARTGDAFAKASAIYQLQRDLSKLHMTTSLGSQGFANSVTYGAQHEELKQQVAWVKGAALTSLAYMALIKPKRWMDEARIYLPKVTLKQHFPKLQPL